MYTSVVLPVPLTHFVLFIQIEESEIKEGGKSRRRSSTSLKRSARRERSPTPSRGARALQSPLPSLPSNTADILKARGRSQVQSTANWGSETHSASYGRDSPLPSLPSNTADIRTARGESSGRSEQRSESDLARFCDSLYISQRR